MLETAIRIKVRLLRLGVDRRGVTAVEYAVIAAVIAMVVVTAMTGMGRGVAATFNHAGG